MKPTSRKRLALVLGGVFALSMIMGAGPGVLLVNTPQPWLGLPSLCTWGLLWYSVQALVAISAYLFVWRDLPVGPAGSNSSANSTNSPSASSEISQ